MYNRYIGNTGKFYRVDDDAPMRDPPQPPPALDRPVPHRAPPPPPPGPGSIFSQPELLGGIKGFLGGLLPEGMELGDLLLILVLLLLYIEKEDEEILIILSVLLFMGFK